MALMHVMYTLQEQLDFKLYIVAVDHGLREDAKTEVDIAFNYAMLISNNSLPFFFKKVTISGSSNIQEKARNERYKAIREVKESIGADYIATAHHMEDKAETVLMRVIRGTSVKGLNVLEPINKDILRPMIKARKRDVMLHISRKSIP